MSQSLMYGIHAIMHVLQRQPERVLQLYVTKERHDQRLQAVLQIAQTHAIAINVVPKATLEKMVSSANHQGIVAECKKPKTYTEHDIATMITAAIKPVCFLLLDGVQDPHNLGACFRSADAFGITAIIAPKDKSVGITPVVTKVASGGTETIPFIQVTNLARSMDTLKELGVWLYGAAAEAKQTVFQTDLTGPIGIVLGSEGTGLRRLTQEKCDNLIKIPMAGTVSSLNVAVATGIFLAEVTRQRQS